MRRLQLSRLRSFGTRLLSPLCSATSGCVCVRSSMRFLQIALNGCMIVVIWCCHACSVERCRFATGWCEAHCNGCMNVAWGLCWGGSRSTKPCVFPCKVAAAGDERYLCVRLCAAVVAAVVPDAIGFSSAFCSEWLCLCA